MSFDVSLSKAFDGKTKKTVIAYRATVVGDSSGNETVQSLELILNHYGAQTSLSFDASALGGVTSATIKSSLSALIESKLNTDGTLK